jgi:hypothetical protein
LKSGTRLLRRFLGLSFEKQVIVVQVAVLLAAVRLGLKTLPFRKMRALVDRFSEPSGLTPTGDGANTPEETVEHVLWAVDVIGRRMPGSCLTQAFAARILLGRRGHPTRLHIGAVKEEGGSFLAHAWLESNGRVVIGGHELERYTPLISMEK